MAETITREQYLTFLNIAPTDLLVEAGNALMVDLQNTSEGSPEAETLGIMLMMLGREYDLRQVEPLWRKAHRFAIRNSETFKQVGKIAACVTAGAILGVSLDNS